MKERAERKGEGGTRRRDRHVKERRPREGEGEDAVTRESPVVGRRPRRKSYVLPRRDSSGADTGSTVEWTRNVSSSTRENDDLRPEKLSLRHI